MIIIRQEKSFALTGVNDIYRHLLADMVFDIIKEFELE